MRTMYRYRLGSNYMYNVKFTLQITTRLEDANNKIITTKVIYCRTQKTVNTSNILGMFIVL